MRRALIDASWDIPLSEIARGLSIADVTIDCIVAMNHDRQTYRLLVEGDALPAVPNCECPLVEPWFSNRHYAGVGFGAYQQLNDEARIESCEFRVRD